MEKLFIWKQALLNYLNKKKNMNKFFLIVFLLISTNAFSAEGHINFTIQKFEEAKKNGETVVVTAWNKYCGTCKRQKVVLAQAEKDFKDVLFLYYSHP